MERYFKRDTRKLVLFFCFFVFLFSSCQEGGDAGDLWGQWRMTNSDSQFLNFSGKVALFRDNKGTQVFGNFQHMGDSIFIQCVSIEQRQADTLFVEDRFGFKPFTDIRVKIATLDSENLVLTKDSQTWSFTIY